MNIKRETYLEQIRSSYDLDIIKVLTGVRRSGKSVLLNQIKEEIIQKNNVPLDHIVSINFEEVTYEALLDHKKLNDYVESKIEDDQKYYLFFDEIQHVESFERTLASLKATKNVSIFVTGSNSKLLSGKLSSLLVGRCLEYKIYPFSYAEALQWYRINKMDLPANFFMDYLRFGGFPFRFNYSSEEAIKKYLRAIFDSIMERDVIDQNGRIDKNNLLSIARYLIVNSGKEFSYENIRDYFKKENGEDLSSRTFYRYLERLEEAYLITRIKKYDVPSKRMLKHSNKIYVVDNGLKTIEYTSSINSFSFFLENLVYNELRYRGYEVFSGKKNKGEIDFIAIKDNKKCFIQVCFHLDSQEVYDREFNAFHSIRDNSPKFVISLDDWDYSHDSITNMNIIDWFEGKKDLFVS